MTWENCHSCNRTAKVAENLSPLHYRGLNNLDCEHAENKKHSLTTFWLSLFLRFSKKPSTTSHGLPLLWAHATASARSMSRYHLQHLTLSLPRMYCPVTHCNYRFLLPSQCISVVITLHNSTDADKSLISLSPSLSPSLSLGINCAI